MWKVKRFSFVAPVNTPNYPEQKKSIGNTEEPSKATSQRNTDLSVQSNVVRSPSLPSTEDTSLLITKPFTAKQALSCNSADDKYQGRKQELQSNGSDSGEQNGVCLDFLLIISSLMQAQVSNKSIEPAHTDGRVVYVGNSRL